MIDTTFLTAKEVAKILRCAEGTAYRKIREGVIPGIKVFGLVRVPMEDLTKHIEAEQKKTNAKQNPANSNEDIEILTSDES